MQEQLKFIPLDKSHSLCLGAIDIIHGRGERFLREIDKWAYSNNNNVPIDVRAACSCARVWNDPKSSIPVGNSKTLYCLLKFAMWLKNDQRMCLVGDDLFSRETCRDPSVTKWDQKKLMTLEGGSPQWASASVISGDKEKIYDAPYHLSLTYRAIHQWNTGKYALQLDKPILGQSRAFQDLLKSRSTSWEPETPEDYCFARSFDKISLSSGRQKWPFLMCKASNRILQMETAMSEYNQGKTISSYDHRIVQAIAMKSLFDSKSISFSNPTVVDKSWPSFWEFLQAVNKQSLI